MLHQSSSKFIRKEKIIEKLYSTEPRIKHNRASWEESRPHKIALSLPRRFPCNLGFTYQLRTILSGILKSRLFRMRLAPPTLNTTCSHKIRPETDGHGNFPDSPSHATNFPYIFSCVNRAPWRRRAAERPKSFVQKVFFCDQKALVQING